MTTGKNNQPDTPSFKAPLPDQGTSQVLLARAREGDEASLRELIFRYEERIRRIARIRLRNSELRRHCDSMDIVQETYGAILPHLESLTLSSPGGVLAWLAKAATHRFYDIHAHHNAQKRDVGREVPIIDARVSAGEVGGMTDGARSPLEALAAAEMVEIIDNAVADLPEDQQRVVILKDYCDQGWSEIAADMNRSHGAVTMLYHRAKIALRRALKTHVPEGD